MPTIQADDGVRLYAESTGSGTPVLFIHEFAGDHRSWEPQVQYFSGAFRCITYSARGYPPSDVPADPSAYSQQRAVDDAIYVLDALGVRRAHVVGLSMGGFTALHLAMSAPGPAAVGGGGRRGVRRAARAAGAVPARVRDHRGGVRDRGRERVAQRYAVGPARVQFQNKDQRGWAEFAAALGEHSSAGSALTMRGVQAARPSLYGLGRSWPRSACRCSSWPVTRTRAAWSPR